MTTPDHAEVYLAFMMHARGDAETELVSIRPETPEAVESVRARIGRVKASWSAPHPINISFAQGDWGHEEGGSERDC